MVEHAVCVRGRARREIRPRSHARLRRPSDRVHQAIQGVSAKKQKIPDLPIVTVAEDEVTLPVVAHNAPLPEPKTIALKNEWQRWNDYGIGLFLQGDLKGRGRGLPESD